MSLKFFTPSDLEKYYDKKFGNISPIDKPLDKYMAGHSKTKCKKCGNKLSVTCGYSKQNSRKNPIDAFIDYAYCDSCELAHTRARKVVNIPNNAYDYQCNHKRIDEREEYLCKHCNQRHLFAVPDSEYKISEPVLTSYESITVPCECGETVYMNNIKFPDTKKCSNCSRNYEFNVYDVDM